ncbi:hypothetical protein GGR50DRAFT_697619 [Xylaria sp. CBS 124048]|nr:hypothetical protein GGR50DRAFT_697619 [Xylaria sp. CBS 124048]
MQERFMNSLFRLPDPFVDSDSESESSAASTSSDGKDCDHDKVPPIVERLDDDANMVIIVGRKKCVEEGCTALGPKKSTQIEFWVNSRIVTAPSMELTNTLCALDCRMHGVCKIKWGVLLPDDDPQAIKVIFHVLYHRYPASPYDLHPDLERLLNLTIAAEKYRVVPWLARWTAGWIRDIRHYYVDRKFSGKSTEDLESLLWIFYVLGHQPLYAYTILTLAFHTQLDANGKLTDPVGNHCFNNELRQIPVPPGAIRDVTHVRMMALKAIRKDLKAVLEDHLHGNRNKTEFCTRWDERDDYGWRRSVLNMTIKALKDEGGWPIPYAENMANSPNDLLEFFRANPNTPWFEHSNDGKNGCDADRTFWERIKRVLNDLRYNISEVTSIGITRHSVESGLCDYLAPPHVAHRPDKGSWTLKEVSEFQISMLSLRHVPSREWPDWI